MRKMAMVVGAVLVMSTSTAADWGSLFVINKVLDVVYDGVKTKEILDREDARAAKKRAEELEDRAYAEEEATVVVSKLEERITYLKQQNVAIVGADTSTLQYEGGSRFSYWETPPRGATGKKVGEIMARRLSLDCDTQRLLVHEVLIVNTAKKLEFIYPNLGWESLGPPSNNKITNQTHDIYRLVCEK